MAFRLTSNLKPLTSEEEASCFKALKEGTDKEQQAAIDKLVESNLKLVYLEAHQFRSSGVPFEDLVSAGSEGLLHAIEKFDISKGTKFITYGVWWIRQRMRLAIQNFRIVRLPAKAGVIRARLLRSRASYLEEFAEEPSLEDLSDYSGIPIEQINKIMNSLSFGISLEDTGDDDENLALEETLASTNDTSDGIDEEMLEDKELLEALKQHVAKLNKRDQYILKLRFGLEEGHLPATLEEVAQEVGRCRERCRQLQSEALQHLKKKLKEKA